MNPAWATQINALPGWPIRVASSISLSFLSKSRSKPIGLSVARLPVPIKQRLERQRQNLSTASSKRSRGQQFGSRTILKISPESPLLDACTAALDEDHQNDYEQGAGDNPNDGCVIHFDFPFKFDRVSNAQSQP